MSSIVIKKADILQLDVEAVVNAANEGLHQGGGICGAIFSAAGAAELNEACRAIGHCDTGMAVITPGFKLKAEYIIHTVGPVWHGGSKNEEELLYGAYYSSLELARENNIHSIAFPVISSGIFGYPKDAAWEVATRACRNFIDKNASYDIDIVIGYI